jgi:hypothetical protein
MANFCLKCGAPLSGPFCVKCGADARSTGPSVQPQSRPPTAQTPSPQSAPLPTVPAAKQGISPLAKLGITVVAIIFVGGAAAAGGLYTLRSRNVRPTFFSLLLSPFLFFYANAAIAQQSNKPPNRALEDSLSWCDSRHSGLNADVNRGFTPPFLDAPSRVIYEIAFNNRTQRPARVEEQRCTNTHLRLRDSEVSDGTPLRPG